ncbi:two-component sensor histidine kinase [Bacillus sp. MUM 116]|uniref:sensor histidine kinase n=1 Tax=Bacillus sp. MUM 116 TaxID=1678002 RepID=UPI0008F57F8C|nr:ATP-binding protein [Bacillus sp. MUM 116]OIK16485.1 two-component sensor histidine kinase [Bacillus sp. MUM 116]
MNNKFLLFLSTITNPREKDVFKNTQGRLTRMYSGLLMLFLIVFIIIVYSVLYTVIIKNQESELQSLIDQEAKFMENYLLKNAHSTLVEVQDQAVVFAGSNQLFYYVVDSRGQLLIGNEADSRLRPELMSLVKRNFSKNQQMSKQTIHSGKNHSSIGEKREFRPREDPHDIRLLIASKPIYVKDQYIGQLYIGKDISFAYQLLHWLLLILSVIGIVFFGVALYMSFIMSKRAMVPISAAFSRQREFVGDASHELRTPLSVLLSSIDAMEMTVEPQKDEFIGRLLSNMRQEVKHMTNLVGDLLTLARSDSNKMELKAEEFDFWKLGEITVESIRPLADAKGISLYLNDQSVLLVIGDPQRLSQALYILLDNAIKYTPNGGNVSIQLVQEGNFLIMKVQDNGIGIEAKDLPYIFERFYRADKSRARQMGGHGLGLSIAKWIVETHQGTIKVSSEIGKGSTFTVFLPIIGNK